MKWLPWIVIGGLVLWYVNKKGIPFVGFAR